ncbi:NAD dependent epimerase/dehydratase family protein-like protein [Saccharata proteae CBS 121410]|uniref:NAD dependent epimerase/dehydratase family protein-like protein n=1 Tax=Saccharata proteae CBS 121410 TaxID=1314787 RepID=A0A9P4HRU3_9PEZI|nr:NAD dependent epimerase/dehydratase family protein-like protein [Saccharata proteae CBS 121410]
MASAAAKRKLVVCGGNGFLGSRICKAATARGWDVTSLSRSGEPSWAAVSSSPNAPSWSKDVTWAKANILQPSTYTQYLENADAVVHSMGILLEADYKGVLQGKEPIMSGLSRAFSKTKQGSQNPLDRKEGEGLEPQEQDGQLTYELMNRDSAIGLAKEASAHNVSSFVFISAAAGAPVLPQRYITTKREAESTIASAFPKMRSIFIRAPFMWDSSRTFTVPLAAATGVAAMMNSAVGGRLTWLMGAGGTKPLKADLVGEAVVEAVENGETKGPVEVPEIEELAKKAWRKNML